MLCSSIVVGLFGLQDHRYYSREHTKVLLGSFLVGTLSTNCRAKRSASLFCMDCVFSGVALGSDLRVRVLSCPKITHYSTCEPLLFIVALVGYADGCTVYQVSTMGINFRVSNSVEDSVHLVFLDLPVA